MYLQRLELDHFRLYERLRLEVPRPGLCLVGANATGKTSLLEAIYYLATARSFRFAADADLARHGAEGFVLRATLVRADRELQLALSYRRGGKTAAVDGERCSRLSDILGRLVTCCFTVEDLDTIRGSAGRRRRFLDLLLGQVSPRYTRAAAELQANLKQRNAALRREPFDAAAVRAWDGPLARSAALVTELRRAAVDELIEPARLAFTELSGTTLHLRLDYEGALEETRLGAAALEEPFLELWRRNLERDRRRGYTTKGPHRDDLALRLDDVDLRRYASRGQQRLAVVALRLAEAEFLARRTGTRPVFLLDDVASELDDTISARLLPALDERVDQLILTCLPQDLDKLGAGRPAFGVGGGAVEAL
jgi:DNA replication and repair protein RecF